MVKPSRTQHGVLLVAVSLVLILALSAATTFPKPSSPAYGVSDVETLGWVFIPNDLMVDGTLVGGLSGLVYDAHRDVYYALSDDKGEDGGDPRYYELTIDVSDFSLDDGDVQFTGMTYLRDHRGHHYGVEAIDPEGFELVAPGQFFIGSEGNIDDGTQPFIDRFNPSGKQNRALPIPERFVSVPTSGARDNLVYESLTSTPDRRYLYAGTENALVQDGPIATYQVGSPSRVIEYRLNGLRPMREFVYCVEPIPNSTGGGDNGLVELQALDNQGSFLAMERSFVGGFGNTIRLFQVSTNGATDVSGIDALGWSDCPGGDGTIQPMEKTFLADFNDDLGVDTDAVLDNMEGMTFGPPLPDGRLPLLVVSDNNFNPRFQDTIFVALAVTLEPVDG